MILLLNHSNVSRLLHAIAYGHGICRAALLFVCLLPLVAVGQPGKATGHRQRLDQQTLFVGMHIGQLLVTDSTFEEMNDYGYAGHKYAPPADTARLFGYLVCPWQVRTDDGYHITSIELTTTDSLVSYQVLRALQVRYGPGIFMEHGAYQTYIWTGSGTRLFYYLRSSNNFRPRGTLYVVEYPSAFH